MPHELELIEVDMASGAFPEFDEQRDAHRPALDVAIVRTAPVRGPTFKGHHHARPFVRRSLDGLLERLIGCIRVTKGELMAKGTSNPEVEGVGVIQDMVGCLRRLKEQCDITSALRKIEVQTATELSLTRRIHGAFESTCCTGELCAWRELDAVGISLEIFERQRRIGECGGVRRP
jgi:hypothetical protein